jgi:hypothetical protein
MNKLGEKIKSKIATTFSKEQRKQVDLQESKFDNLLIDTKRGMITNIKTGKLYRSTKNDYLHIGNNLAHRLIWEYVNGPIPDGLFIDHINGIRNDNRIDNLRLVTTAENSQNRQTTNSNNRSGAKIPGVSYCKHHDRFRVTLIFNQRQFFFGYYKELSEAEEAALLARRELFKFNTL